MRPDRDQACFMARLAVVCTNDSDVQCTRSKKWSVVEIREDLQRSKAP